MCVVDLNSKVQSLLERIEKLESEKQQIREEFGHQRAKMKELYLQKEGIFILKSVRDEWIFSVECVLNTSDYYIYSHFFCVWC
jgi:predicted nuclease with TOPRIM domain